MHLQVLKLYTAQFKLCFEFTLHRSYMNMYEYIHTKNTDIALKAYAKLRASVLVPFFIIQAVMHVHTLCIQTWIESI